ncbi:MAG: hypothetical protein WC455_14130 [Dehalococcoidia bacterium]|jgi:hypothetical protein
MTPYLDSLRQYADFPVTFVGVEFIPPDLGDIETISMTAAQNYGAPPETECIQHGSFASVIPGDDDEVLVYTDADFRMQRKIEQDELDLLTLKHGEVVTSWNGSPDETLALEATRLGVRGDLAQWGGDLESLSVYNVGFLAMTRTTWNELYSAYTRDYERIEATFSHYARQQWLISYHVQRLGMNIKIAPWSLHAHGHFGLKPGMDQRGREIYWNGRLAAFRHYLCL